MLRDKMLAVIDEVNGEVAEREELTEAIAIALLTRKNLFVLGDTGQAKSYAINLFRKRIEGAKQFERLLSKQADEEQLFGRIDLSSLIPGSADPTILANDFEYQNLLDKLARETDGKELEATLTSLEMHRRKAYALYGNRPRLVTTGKIPDSEIVFLDEIFKANDGILNSLLTALNERKYTDEGETVDIPTISFFAASNEIPNFSNPEESILKPLYDRLELKLVTEYVQERDARLAVLRKKLTASTGNSASTFTLDELTQMQAEVAAVRVPESIDELMDDILCELRSKDVHISDRKYFGYHPLVQARAWLDGRNEVLSTDLLILRHYLWTTIDERTKIKEVLERKCINPLGDELNRIKQMALETYDEFESSAGADETRRIGKLRDEFVALYEMLRNLQSPAQGNDIQLINDAIDSIENLSRQAHGSTTFTYTPLSELWQLSH